MTWADSVPNLLIGLREGLEAVLPGVRDTRDWYGRGLLARRSGEQAAG